MRRLLCKIDLWPFFWFHKPEVIETYDSCTRKLKCIHCGMYFAMSDRHQAILPWGSEFEEITKMIYGIPRSKI